MKIILLFIITSFLFNPVYSASFSSLSSNKDKLKGFYILETGNIEEVPKEINYNSGFMINNINDIVYKINDSCFKSNDYIGYIGSRDNASLLLKNAKQEVYLALLKDSISDLDIKLESVTLVECHNHNISYQRQINECKTSSCINKITEQIKSNMLKRSKEFEIQTEKLLQLQRELESELNSGQNNINSN
ncbi:hypothetical protein [Methylomonas sp. AM2-LC]|uniref:hypothetical protein n=1 Tax=Methylomonas sp. AM2-LC TaxID=3153301 RepID=UPI00326361D7